MSHLAKALLPDLKAVGDDLHRPVLRFRFAYGGMSLRDSFWCCWILILGQLAISSHWNPTFVAVLADLIGEELHRLLPPRTNKVFAFRKMKQPITAEG